MSDDPSRPRGAPPAPRFDGTVPMTGPADDHTRQVIEALRAKAKERAGQPPAPAPAPPATPQAQTSAAPPRPPSGAPRAQFNTTADPTAQVGPVMPFAAGPALGVAPSAPPPSPKSSFNETAPANATLANQAPTPFAVSARPLQQAPAVAATPFDRPAPAARAPAAVAPSAPLVAPSVPLVAPSAAPVAPGAVASARAPVSAFGPMPPAPAPAPPVARMRPPASLPALAADSPLGKVLLHEALRGWMAAAATEGGIS